MTRERGSVGSGGAGPREHGSGTTEGSFAGPGPIRPHMETPDDMKPSFIRGKFKDVPGSMGDSQIKSGSMVELKGNKPFVKEQLMKRGYPYASVSRSIFGKEWEVIDTYMDGEVVGIPVYSNGLTRYFPKDMFTHKSKAPS